MNGAPLSVACIVPARIGSTRFPGKPLVPICGVPMILRTLQQGALAGCFDELICATDSSDIETVVRQAGFRALLTPSDLRTGSDRVAWVAARHRYPLVVNLQGDEPVADPEVLRRLTAALRKEPDIWWTAAAPISPTDRENPTVVKVQVDIAGRATDFVRILPSQEDSKNNWYRHLGYYGYSFDQLHLFSQSPSSAAETERRLEQLRLFPDVPIGVVVTGSQSLAVDCPEDIPAVERYLSERKDEGS